MRLLAQLTEEVTHIYSKLEALENEVKNLTEIRIKNELEILVLKAQIDIEGDKNV